MLQSNGNRFFHLIIVALAMENARIGETTSIRDELVTFCGEPGMDYYRGGIFICCQQKPMNTTVSEELHDLRKCSEAMKEVDGDDFLASLYRRHLCMVKLTGATTNDLKTLQNYLKFITQHYDESIKTSIMQIAEQCGVPDTEKDELKQFIAFHDCFLRTEAKVCQRLNNETKTITTKVAFSQNYCSEKYNSDTKGYCCKGKMTPVDFRALDVHSPLNSTQISSSMKCRASFEKVQTELLSNSSKSSTDGSVKTTSANGVSISSRFKWLCYSACHFRRSNFTSIQDLNFSLDIIKASMFSTLSKTLRNKFMLVFDKYGTENVHLISNNSSMSISDAAKLMLGFDSLSHIETYCRLYNYVYYLPYGAMDEYCYGEEASRKMEMELKWLLSDVSKKSGLGI